MSRILFDASIDATAIYSGKLFAAGKGDRREGAQRLSAGGNEMTPCVVVAVMGSMNGSVTAKVDDSLTRLSA